LSLSIGGWNFSTSANSLVARFQFVGYPPITNISDQGIDAQGLQVFVLSSSLVTTSIRFLRVATVGTTRVVPVNIAFDGLLGLALQFPSFTGTLTYDPDFSITIDTDSDDGGGDGGGGGELALLALISLGTIPLLCVLVVVMILIIGWLITRWRSRPRENVVNFSTSSGNTLDCFIVCSEGARGVGDRDILPGAKAFSNALDEKVP